MNTKATLRLMPWVAAAALMVTGAAQANPTTFFGLDQSPSTSTTNSDTAHTNFLSQLSSGVATENFASFSAGTTPPITLTFPGSSGSLTADLEGSGSTRSSNSSGAHGISGSNYYLVVTSDQDEFNIDFGSSPISAFGFYGSDISDSGSHLFLELTDTNNDTTQLQVTQNTTNSNSNQLFFGFVDSSKSYTNIEFISDGSGDYFGFDDMTIGDLGQVSAAVPEPSAMAAFAFGLAGLGLGLFARRRNHRRNGGLR